ncbi:MAG: HAD-IB family hydrolase, partial [bacterium]|nr:HAD-IB family hydrolase [bacterium]
KFSIEDSGKGSRYTRPQEPYPFREGKVLMAEAFAGKLNISLEECAFYSDSINDEPLLSKAGFPVVVNPDPLLEKKALEKKWPIINLATNRN